MIRILSAYAVIVFIASGATIVEAQSKTHVTRHDAAKKCWQSLQSFCGTKGCPEYATAVASMERDASEVCFTAVIGTCGEFRYTYRSDHFTSEERYFN